MEERIIKDINNLLAQLFQKMHEAGYEWDAEKKELKKVEQKPAWSEEDEKMIKRKDFWLYSRRCKGREYEEIHNWLKSLKDRVQSQNTWKPSD